tara:strand:- start:156 stop:614 length:459 start_codon:yes stop_codon:yes gene_type:complete
MRQKILSLFLALVAIGCIGYGITGFYAIDYQGDYCDSDSDCSTGVCCYFYGESNGVCDYEQNCDSIELLSLETSNLMMSYSPEVVQEEVEEEVDRSYIAMVLGALILLIVLVVAYVEWKHEKHGVSSRLGHVHHKKLNKVVNRKLKKLVKKK